MKNGTAVLAAICMLALATCVFLCACAPAQQAPSAEQASSAPTSSASFSGTQQPRRIIIDTDTGGDDASALILAARNSNAEIVGVTVLAGNVPLEQAARNALMALEVAGCEAPVYRGASNALDGTERETFSVFGSDGMGDADLVHPSGTPAEGDAVTFILDTVRANPGEIEIVTIGPATNIAKAIQREPETMRSVKMIWSMGTTGFGPGNATPVAEFNVYHDAPAYKVMLESGVPLTIVGLDVCGGDAEWSDAQFQELADSGERGAFIVKSFSMLRKFYEENRPADNVENCDGTAMMCALDPGFVTDTRRCYASCITDEGETYGQVILYKEGHVYDGPVNGTPSNVTLVTGVDASSFFDRFKATIC